MKSGLRFLMVGLLFASLTNCKTQHSPAAAQSVATSTDTSSPAAPLAGTYWKLTELNGKTVATGRCFAVR